MLIVFKETQRQPGQRRGARPFSKHVKKLKLALKLGIQSISP
jgi:hypothetical protein